LGKSKAGSQIAFKGGTALKLFFDLPHYSEDIDYDVLPGASAEGLIGSITDRCTRKGWEITDSALKYHTILVELRFSQSDKFRHPRTQVRNTGSRYRDSSHGA
jgi:predicted nucleotidyltransferase component of viral defense system